MVTVSECRPLSLQIVGNSDSQPKWGSIWAEDTIYILVSSLRCTTQLICNTYLLQIIAYKEFYILITNTYLLTLLKKIIWLRIGDNTSYIRLVLVCSSIWVPLNILILGSKSKNGTDKPVSIWECAHFIQNSPHVKISATNPILPPSQKTLREIKITLRFFI